MCEVSNTFFSKALNNEMSVKSSSSALQEYYKDDAIRDQLSTMLQQDNSGTYSCTDYLSFSPLSSEDAGEQETEGSSSALEVDCRIKMTQWCFQVVDYAKFKRSTVSIAMSLLDRFISQHRTSPDAHLALHCRKSYQLACMTTLFMAIKINEKSDVDGGVFSELSRSTYSVRDISAMEMKILVALKWRLNGPTALDFLRYTLAILPSLKRLQQQKRSVSSFVNVTDLCGFQIDLAVGDYYFVTQKQSTIAVAALLNALELNMVSLFPSPNYANQDKEEVFEASYLSSLMKEISVIMNIDVFSTEVENARTQLQFLLTSNGVQYPAQGQEKRRHKSSKKRLYSSASSSSSSSSSSSATARTAASSTKSPPATRPHSPSCVSRITKAAPRERLHSSRRGIIHRSSSFQDAFQKLMGNNKFHSS